MGGRGGVRGAEQEEGEEVKRGEMSRGRRKEKEGGGAS